jgi:hypothetical protein
MDPILSHFQARGDGVIRPYKYKFTNFQWRVAASPAPKNRAHFQGRVPLQIFFKLVMKIQLNQKK